MDTLGARICAAAMALVGTPFRLHGRCVETGVDCVGLALLSLRGAGLQLPDPPAYAMRAGPVVMLPGWMCAAGFVPVRTALPGDLLVVRVGPLQPHMVIEGGMAGVIHAHAGLGRVVQGPMPSEWAEISRWRHGASA